MLSEHIAKKSFRIDAKGEVSLTATIGISYGMDSLLTNADIALSLGACRSPKVKNCKSDLSELRNIWTDYNFS